jgi:hypothetical protein
MYHAYQYCCRVGLCNCYDPTEFKYIIEHNQFEGYRITLNIIVYNSVILHCSLCAIQIISINDRYIDVNVDIII